MAGSEDILRKMYEVELQQKNVSRIFQNSDMKSIRRKQFVKNRVRDIIAAIIVVFLVFVILN